MSDSTTNAKIVWFELPATDTERARSFYSELFGWQFAGYGSDDYHLSYEAGGAIHGGPAGEGLMAYFGVADAAAAAERVRALGGAAGDRNEIPGTGYYVRCADLDGNRFGLYEAANA